jgi:hypothetical protein
MAQYSARSFSEAVMSFWHRQAHSPANFSKIRHAVAILTGPSSFETDEIASVIAFIAAGMLVGAEIVVAIGLFLQVWVVIG